ncbi:MAG: hypothetical protein IT245_03955 [Bacteroidia bacterium]|nr:hypothetical protein [Bacteroidia bacterium]
MLRKFFLMAITYFIFNGLKAQNEADAIRYAFQTIGSTARSYGIAGAFGGIGADFSCASINPSGMARYRSNQFGLSTSFYNIRDNASYINMELQDKKFNFNLPNVGFVFNIPGEDLENKNPTGFVNFVLGFNMNRMNNFHMSSFYKAINSSSSITHNWAERATSTGDIPDNFSRYSLELLAYNAWTIDKDTSSLTPAYISAYGKNNSVKVDQLGTLTTKGAINDYNVSLAANYQHILLVGLSVGVKSIRYIYNSSFKETDARNSPVKDINSVQMDEYIKTSGLGLNAKLGVTFSPNENIRIGYAFHSPTVYNLKDSYNYAITSVFDFGAIDQFGDSRLSGKVMTPSAIYNYKVTSPSRNVFSFALVDKNTGFISVDLETVNYSSARLTATKKNANDYNFTEENLRIKSLLNSNAFNVRIGGEYISDIYRFRAGYARYPSPYKKDAVPYVKNLVNNMYTLGFGIKTKKYALDFALVNALSAQYTVPYQLSNTNRTAYSVTHNLRSTNFIISTSIPL